MMNVSPNMPQTAAEQLFATPAADGFSLQAKTISKGTTVETRQKMQEDAYAAFDSFMNKTPGQRMREQVLKMLGLTEEDIKAMPPEERRKVELKIAAMMKEMQENKIKEELAKQQEKTAKVSGAVGAVLIDAQAQNTELSAHAPQRKAQEVLGG